MTQSQNVWVYLSSRQLKVEEVREIKQALTDFFGQWNAHGEKLHAQADILHNVFLVIKLEPTGANASGCSIDACVNFIKELESGYDFTFFNRSQLACRINGSIRILNTDTFRNHYQKGLLTDETTVFNTLVTTNNELENSWEIPLGQSWHKRLV